MGVNRRYHLFTGACFACTDASDSKSALASIPPFHFIFILIMVLILHERL